MSTVTSHAGKVAGGAVAGGGGAGAQALADRQESGGGLMKMQFGGRISQRDILAVTRQLAVMMKAGINISDALHSMSQQTQNPKLAKLLEELHVDVEAGKPFSEAIGKHPKYFNPLYINMIKASELSGSFSHALQRIAQYTEQQLETRSMVFGALMYPAIIGTMAIITTIFMLVFVLPKFLTLFKGKEDLLPLPTKMLLALSASMQSHWYLYVGGAIAAAVGLIMFIRTPTGEYALDTLKLRIPIFKKLFHCLYLSRGLKTMGELLNSGVPMLETISITSKITGNIHYRDLWLQVREAVKEGQTVAQTLLKSSLMPGGVTQMIAAGEQSGNMGGVLNDISEFYDRELKAVIKTSTAMLEPMMIVAMGALVGFIAASVMLPIFSMSKVTK